VSEVICVIQARTNSTRLPAKVLLPLAGYPLVVLAAKRAANNGCNVIVITSHEASDDALCDLLSKNELPFYRGSLDNTLERFINALKEYNDDTIVVRLTADNPVPDGDFINELINEYEENSLSYLCSTGEKTGLPYGLSAEVMKLRMLREAYQQTTDAYDLEHVTPFIRRKYGDKLFVKYQSLKLGGSRCTIDELQDYLDMAEVFTHLSNPLSESSFNIIKKLK